MGIRFLPMLKQRCESRISVHITALVISSQDRRISLHFLCRESLISLPLQASHEHLRMVPFTLVEDDTRIFGILLFKSICPLPD